MVKACIALIIVLLFVLGIAPVVAQEPLPPLPPVPIGPPPGIGEPIPKAPEQYLPTWQAPPPIPPTPVNFDWYDVRAEQPVPVYWLPSLTSFAYTTLPTGTVVTVRWAGPGWLQLESGYAAGSYILDDARIRRV